MKRFMVNLFVFMIMIGLVISCSKNHKNSGYVVLEPGFPPSVKLRGYTYEDQLPLYAVILPGVYPTKEGIVIKKVLPGQEEALLPVIPNQYNHFTYDQCLILFEHLAPAYFFRNTEYNKELAKKLQEMESIHPVDFYPFLKQQRVPPFNLEMKTKMKAAISAQKNK